MSTSPAFSFSLQRRLLRVNEAVLTEAPEPREDARQLLQEESLQFLLREAEELYGEMQKLLSPACRLHGVSFDELTLLYERPRGGSVLYWDFDHRLRLQREQLEDPKFEELPADTRQRVLVLISEMRGLPETKRYEDVFPPYRPHWEDHSFGT